MRLYNYEVKYSDGSVEKNVYSMDEKKAFEMLGKIVAEHFESQSRRHLEIVSAKVIAV